MRLDTLHGLARDHGLVVRSDVVPEHLTKEAWRHAHRTGLLIPVHPGVSRCADASVTPEQSISAAIIAAAPTAGEARTMAAGRAAAYLYGVGVRPDDPIHISVRGRPRPAPLVGVKIHRPINNLDLVAQGGPGEIPRTRAIRTVLDVAAWDPALTSVVLEELITKRVITIQDAHAAVRRYSKQGRPGVRVLRRTVEAWALRQRPPDSVLEARFAKLRKEHNLPEFEFQRPVGRHRPDFCRTLEQLIVECDGFNDHGRRQEQIERDNERDAELTAQGWLVMRFSWHQINHRSAWVASRIGRTLATRAAQLGIST